MLASPATGRGTALQADSTTPSAAGPAVLVKALHASLLYSVDLMGVGSNVPQTDTTAEDTVALSAHRMPSLHFCCPRMCMLLLHLAPIPSPVSAMFSQWL
jgi:hypothetical protein